MMFSNFDHGNLDGTNNLSNVELLRDIEEISNALYVDRKPLNLSPNLGLKPQICDSKSMSKAGFDGEDELLRKGNSNSHSSIWHWKPLKKALSHIMHKKFGCYFFCHVHSVENLSLDLDGCCVSVCLKRKDSVLRTRSLGVSNGKVEFEETLVSKCRVYGAKSGLGNFMKYDPKHFLLCVSVVGVEVVDVGKHWVDLTRLLPLTVEELERDKCSGKWSTSFKLEGKAKDATLHVSFGFLVTKDSLGELGGNVKLPIVHNLEQDGLNRTSSADDCVSSKGNTSLRRVGSVPSSLTNGCSNSYHCLDVKYGWPKDVSDFSNSITMVYGKLEEEGIDDSPKVDPAYERLESLKTVPNSLTEYKDFSGAKHDDGEFAVIEKGMESESTSKEAVMLCDSTSGDLDASTVEVIDVADIFVGDGISSDEDMESGGKEVPGSVASDLVIDKQSGLHAEELSELEQLAEMISCEFKANNINEVSLDTHESPKFEPFDDVMSGEFKVHHKGNKLVKSLSLDDIAKAVAEDFCNMWQQSTSSSPNSNTCLESPRERLLRQFEEDMMTSGNYFLGVDVLDEEAESDHFAPSISSTDYTFDSVDFSPIISKDMNQSVNQASRSKIQVTTLECLETQSLMQRWGLNEDAFLSSPHYSSGGFGSPIFVPSESEEPVGLPPLGEGLEPLLQLKNGGLLRSMNPLLFKNAKNCGSLIMQASKLLVFPVELSYDIMDVLQGMASIGCGRLSKKLRTLLPLDELSGKIIEQLAWEASYDAETHSRSSSAPHETDLEIEIQSSSLVADCNSVISNSTVSNVDLSALALNSIESLTIEGLKIQSGMPNDDAPSSIRVKPVNEAGNYVDELLDLSISLDEWLRLDSGMFSDENYASDQTLKLLRAHRARKLTEEQILQNVSGENRLLGDNLTAGLMIQLRDPLRNYEPVGPPMLGLIQMERVLRCVCLSSDESPSESLTKIEAKIVPKFRLKEVHVAGLNLDSDHTESWASKRQQQTGSRWLLASRLTQKPDSRISKSRSLLRVSTKVLRKPWTRNFLWSISRPVQGVETNTERSSIWDLHTRNPDLIFP